MRNRILMYLFIFSLLFSIFIYVNDKRILDDKQEKIAALENRLEQLKEQNRDLEASGNTAERDFQLEGNESALTYFDKLGIDTKDLSQRIEDEMISQNKSVEDNPLVPYDGINAKFKTILMPSPKANMVFNFFCLPVMFKYTAPGPHNELKSWPPKRSNSASLAKT